jgi:hypothetical protein
MIPNLLNFFVNLSFFVSQNVLNNVQNVYFEIKIKLLFNIKYYCSIFNQLIYSAEVIIMPLLLSSKNCR